MKLSKSRCIRFVAILFSFAPVMVLSSFAVSSLFGDNLPYSKVFDEVSGKALSIAILTQYQAIKAPEPLFAILATGANLISLKYYFFIAVLNVCLFVLIGYLLEKQIFRPDVFLIALIYLSTDFYLWKLAAELHRLKLAAIFTLTMIIFLVRKRSFIYWYILSIGSHIQALIMLPAFFKLSLRLALALLAFSFFIYTFLADYLQTKIMRYVSLNLDDVGIMAIFSVWVLLMMKFVGVAVSRKFFFFMIGTFSAGLIIGTDRVLIVLVEVCVFYFLFEVQKIRNQFSRVGMTIIFCSPLMALNIYRDLILIDQVLN